MDKLTGLRVLVVEDNDILASALAECLEIAGAEVLPPCPSVARALAQLESAGRIDAAVLDVRLEHETSEPIAVRAKESGIAVLLMTGLDDTALPAGLQGFPVCTKPFDTKALIAALRSVRRSHAAATDNAAAS